MSPRLPRWPLVVAILALSVVFWIVAARCWVSVDGVRYHFLDDDQMISMRYARNLAEGVGPVWNAGERVEGYTNFGWMLVMAAVHAAGAPDATAAWWVRLVAWALACAVLWLTARLLALLGVRGWLALAALLPLALANDLVFWAVNGFETTMLTAVFLWALTRTIEQAEAGRIGWPVFLAAGALPVIRADAVDLTAAVVILAIGLRPRPWPWHAALAALPIAAHEAFRVSYYGDWLPNTFYLKVAGRPDLWLGGLGYAKLFAEAYAAPVVLCALALLWSRSRLVRVLALLPAAGVLHVVYTGADIFGYSRFLAPYLPVVLAVAVSAAHELSGGVLGARRAIAALLAVATIAASGIQGRTRMAGMRSDNGVPPISTVVGVLIARHARPESSIAVLAAGCMGYFSRRHAYDMLGKSDRHIARLPPHPLHPTGHNRFDFEWSLGHEPDIVSSFGRALYVSLAEADVTDVMHEPARDSWDTLLVMSPSFQRHYRKNGVPVRYLVNHSALFVRSDSPEMARLDTWRDPVVIEP
jgi:hypothetical protein